jgi:hypothetical protein
MRFVSIGKPHVHHERISVVGAFNLISAGLWFQSHRDESHFLKLSGRRMIALRGLNRTRVHSFRAIQSLPPAGPQDSFSSAAGVRQPSRRKHTSGDPGVVAGRVPSFVPDEVMRELAKCGADIADFRLQPRALLFLSGWNGLDIPFREGLRFRRRCGAL